MLAMSTPTIVFGVIVVVVAIFLIVAVLMQQGKSHNLSGTIAGGAETFFGKTKGQAVNKKLSIVTSVVAVLFVLVVVGFYVSQDTSQYSTLSEYFSSFGTKQTATVDDTSGDTSDADDTADEADTAEAEDLADESDSAADTADESAEG